MRLCSLRFKNLASLAGEWKIDFEDPGFSGGLFAITGPTGSGKTTLLDALCLALYGQTPRLGKVAGENEIMTRGTSDCFAEAVFCAGGHRYAAMWSQSRTVRRSAAKSFQGARHRFSRCDEGFEEVLAEKTTVVASEVERVLRLDFEQFTRTVLLPQGGFAAFLRAKSNERAALLEDLTGGEIYREISRRVYERQKAERQKLSELQIALNETKPMDDAERKKIEERLSSSGDAESALRGAIKEVETALEWYKAKHALDLEKEELARAEDALKEARAAFEPKARALDAAVKADSSKDLHASLVMNRALVRKTEDDIASLVRQSKLCEAERAEAEARAARVRDAQDAIKKREESESPVWDKVRGIDMRLNAALASLKKARDRKSALEARLAQNQKDDAAVKAQIATAAAERTGTGERLEKERAARDELKKREESESPVWDKVRGIDMRLNAALASLKKARDRKSALEARLAQNQKDDSTVKAQLVRADAARQDAEERLTQARAERDKAKDALSRADLGTLSSALREGEPCPLCGSPHHPAPFKGDQSTEILALRRLTESAEQNVSNLEQTLKEHEALLSDLKVNQGKLETASLSDSKELEDARNEASEVEKQAKDLYDERITLFGDKDADAVSRALRSEKARAEKSVSDLEKALKDCEGTLSGLKVEQGKLEVASLSDNKELDEAKEEASEVEKQTKNLYEERTALFGDKDPDAVSRALKDERSKAEKEAAAAQEEKERAQTAASGIAARLGKTRDQLEEQKATLGESEKAFLARINESGFAGESAWSAAVMDASDMERIRDEAKSLEDMAAALEKRRAIAESKKQGDTPHLPEEGLSDAKDAKQKDLTEILQTRGADERTIEIDDARKRRSEELSRDIAVQEKTVNMWASLNARIGSANGDAFSKYVQGVTFRRLIHAANRQLEGLSDRYRLVVDESDALQLNVADLWQGGDIRTSQNLSGGESFIVSLALALALSHGMREVHVDSLFLDEGFGTLDEDTLDTVLECLNRLRESGKLVGVISHVASLQERIDCRLTLTPAASGHSTLSGPGCSRR